MPKTLLFIAIALLLAGTAEAQQLLGTEGDWKIYSVDQDGKKVCYLASTPVKSKGTFKKRGDAYFLVTQKAQDQNEVSASSGYPYKRDTDVHLVIDGKTKFRMFTQGDLSWARDSKQDTRIVEAMKKGYKMTARGTSQVRTYSEDTYSLKGFGKALDQMKDACH